MIKTKNFVTEYILCDCGDNHHGISIGWFNDHEWIDVWISFMIYPKRLIDKIKVCFKILKGEYEYHDILLSDEGIEKLEEALELAKEMRKSRKENVKFYKN